MLARRALDIYTQLHGAESEKFASATGILADILDYFNDVDDDEVLRLHEQAKAIYARVYGRLSLNVAACENNLSVAYGRRANRALTTHDLNRSVANEELALSHYRESARIYRAINHMDDAERCTVMVEEGLRRITALRAAATRG